MNEEIKINVFNIQKFSLHDGPGIRTVVFFKGCPLKCEWCANPESQAKGSQVSFDEDQCVGCAACVAVCPDKCYTLEQGKAAPSYDVCRSCLRCAKACVYGAISTEGEWMTVRDITDIVMQDEAFYRKSSGGVTFSGGEVLCQMDGATVLAKELHERGVHIAAETSGFAPKEDFEKLYDATDMLLYDLKHWDNEKHLEGTGCENGNILDHLKYALEGCKPVRVRIPVVPGFNDSDRDAVEFAGMLCVLGVEEVELLPFHQLGEKKYKTLNLPYRWREAAGLTRDDLGRYQMLMRESGLRKVLL